MVTIKLPGVYVEEVLEGICTIEGVGTSTAAFIGVTEKGSLDKAVLIKRFSEFAQYYGNPIKGSWLSVAVESFFNNGGTRLYVARVGSTTRSAPTEQDYQQAFGLLDTLSDISVIAVPGMGTPSMVSYGASYCQKRRDCFFIGDLPLVVETVTETQQFVTTLTEINSYAAVYFPWLKVKAMSGTGPDSIIVPPSGAVAGLYARTDTYRGVWKAPAGVEASLHGAVGLSATITDQEQVTLNDIGVNVIREFPTHGIVAWGARTLGTQTESEFRYVPVRRTAIFIEQSIKNSIQWAVFEPNDANLWSRLQLVITNFMNQLFRAGAFNGSSQKEAFFVKCDSETNTQAHIDQRIVSMHVGFAPLKPAEFVILRIGLKMDEL